MLFDLILFYRRSATGSELFDASFVWPRDWFFEALDKGGPAGFFIGRGEANPTTPTVAFILGKILWTFDKRFYLLKMFSNNTPRKILWLMCLKGLPLLNVNWPSLRCIFPAGNILYVLTYEELNVVFVEK